MEKFSDDAEVLADVADSGQGLTEWQQKAKTKDSEEILETPKVALRHGKRLKLERGTALAAEAATNRDELKVFF